MSTGGNVKVGPWGGNDATLPWQFKLDDAQITKITIFSDSRSVYSIQFTYKTNNGVSFVSGPFGGVGGNPVTADIDDGELIEIGGTFARNYPPHVVITSLVFKTSNKTYGPYGPGGGINFSLQIPVREGKVAGFFGESGDRLDNLGVILTVRG